MFQLAYSNINSILANETKSISNKIINSEILEIQTSGTTGTPKLIKLTLSEPNKKILSNPDSIYLLTYSPLRWAGISTIRHCIHSKCRLVVPESLNFKDLLNAIKIFKPTHISLTPTMLRMLLLNDSQNWMKNNEFCQITFGGENATQGILDLASQIWPNARITHVYASTELGDICASSDGKEGYPKNKFSNYNFIPFEDNYELEVNGYCTGDIWALSNDRYYFIGRKEEIINIGGNKITLSNIENVVIRLGAVSAKAYPIKNALMGSLVGVSYVGEVAPDALRQLLSESLPKFARPVEINKVESLSLTDTGKIKRS